MDKIDRTERVVQRAALLLADSRRVITRVVEERRSASARLTESQSEFRRVLRIAQGAAGNSIASVRRHSRRLGSIRAQLQIRAKEIHARRREFNESIPKQQAAVSAHRALERVHQQATLAQGRLQRSRQSLREEEDRSERCAIQVCRSSAAPDTSDRLGAELDLGHASEEGSREQGIGTSQDDIAVSASLQRAACDESSSAIGTLPWAARPGSISVLEQGGDLPAGLASEERGNRAFGNFAESRDPASDHPKSFNDPEGVSTRSVAGTVDAMCLEVALPLGDDGAIRLSVVPARNTVEVDLAAQGSRATEICRQELPFFGRSFLANGFVLRRLGFETRRAVVENESDLGSGESGTVGARRSHAE